MGSEKIRYLILKLFVQHMYTDFGIRYLLETISNTKNPRYLFKNIMIFEFYSINIFSE